jgi:hypothetical protein
MMYYTAWNPNIIQANILYNGWAVYINSKCSSLGSSKELKSPIGSIVLLEDPEHSERYHHIIVDLKDQTPVAR